MTTRHFDTDLFDFLRDLKKNNDRDWFKANKARYEESIKEPSLRFISDFGPLLESISPHFDAIPKAVGGSLFRIYRDVRFSKDKRPYKTHAGIHFRHRLAKDVHAPGFYLHLEPGTAFVGVGIWHPDSASLKKIRDSLIERSAAWKRVSRDAAFRERFELAGDSLKTVPRGYDPDHPLIEDLRRKDFIAVAEIDEADATSDGFIVQFAEACKAAGSFNRLLCKAVGVPY